MSGKRWQPPHLDPAKPRDTPVSERREAASRSTWHTPRCLMGDCLEYEEPAYRVGLCRKHANWVRSTMNAHDLESAARQAERSTERAQTRETTAAKIEAGERVPLNGDLPGWVYYLLIDDTIKIGFTSNMHTRMRQYPPTATLLAVEPGTRVVEKRRHNHFGAHLAHGREWFRDVPQLREWIQTIVSEYGTPDHMAYTYRTPGTLPLTA